MGLFGQGCASRARPLILVPRDIERSASRVGDVDARVGYDISWGTLCGRGALRARVRGPSGSGATLVQRLLDSRVEGAKWGCVAGVCETRVRCEAVGCVFDSSLCGEDPGYFLSGPRPRGEGTLRVQTAAEAPLRIRHVRVECP
jgi:hypothetical protein